jgi:hypothetical protein
MAAPIPVAFSEVVNLTTLGISADCIKFGSCSMECVAYLSGARGRAGGGRGGAPRAFHFC